MEPELPPNRGGVRPGNRSWYARSRENRDTGWGSPSDGPVLRHKPQGPPPPGKPGGKTAAARHRLRLKSAGLWSEAWGPVL